MKNRRGTVYLVGAGPGDPDLITVKGLKALRRADVVLFDRLAPGKLLSEAPGHAELIDVGKAPQRLAKGSPISQEKINRLIVERAQMGLTVVRLKGGDPFVFGRGGEEREACRKAGIRCRVIPGVSSALAAPASLGIPVTHREVSRSFAVVTASDNGKGTPLDYKALARLDTLVFLMGRRKLAEISQRLIAAGRSATTPAACIEQATTSRQRSLVSTLGRLPSEADRLGLQSPAVIVVGETAALASSAAFLNAVDGQAPQQPADTLRDIA